MLNKYSHQPLGIEDKIISTGRFISANTQIGQSERLGQATEKSKKVSRIIAHKLAEHPHCKTTV